MGIYKAYKPVLHEWVSMNTFPKDIASSFAYADKDGNRRLDWHNGEIRNFIINLYAKKGMQPPDEKTMYEMYRAFDANKDGGLDVIEAQRLAQVHVQSLCSALGIHFPVTEPVTNRSMHNVYDQ